MRRSPVSQPGKSHPPPRVEESVNQEEVPSSSANPADSIAPPFWSQDPPDNTQPVQLMQQQSNKQDQPQQAALMDELVQYLLGQLEKKGDAGLSSQTITETQQGLPGASGSKTASMDEDPIEDEEEGQKMPAAKMPYKNTEDQSNSTEMVASTTDSIVASISSLSIKSDDTSQEFDSTNASSKKRSVRKELAAALKSHVDILNQRSQVSSAIPKSFCSLAHQAKLDAATQTDQDSTTSTNSNMAVNTVQHRKASREQYYEELAAELLTHWKPPIPESTSFVASSKRRKTVAYWLMEAFPQDG